MAKRNDQPMLFDAPRMPRLSPGAAAIIHAHLPPPNVEQYLASPVILPQSEVTPSVSETPNSDTTQERVDQPDQKIVAIKQRNAANGSQFCLEWAEASLHSPDGGIAGRAPREPPDLKAPANVAMDVPSPKTAISTIRLKWDFRGSFPSPTEAAIDAGVLGDEDLDSEQIKSIHDEHAREAISVLAELDAILDARRRGVDPKTGKPPRTEKSRQNLERMFSSAPERLQHAFDVLMDVYEEAFGDEAATAFRSACHAWNAGYEVVDESADDKTLGENDEPVETRILDDGLPISKPMASAIEQCAFGTEEDGTPVQPSWEELEGITRDAADKLIELMPGSGAPPAEYQKLLSTYAEDFGAEAAQLLDRFIQVQAEKDGDSWDAGHPWHYYERGDNCQPTPLGEIEPDNEAGRHFIESLPKNHKARRSKLPTILADQQKQLQEDQRRYVELAERGVAALGSYDRTITTNGDEQLAWATAVSLKYRHVSAGLGRVEALRNLKF